MDEQHQMSQESTEQDMVQPEMSIIIVLEYFQVGICTFIVFIQCIIYKIVW